MKHLKLKKFLVCVVIMLCFIVLTSCGGGDKEKYNTYKNIQYNKDHSELIINVYTPAQREDDKKVKAMLFLNGENWISEISSSDTSLAEEYASKGVITATMTYRDLGVYGNTENTLYTICEDISTAISKLNLFVKTLGFEIEGLFLHGRYSGGHLAAYYGWACQSEENPYKSVLPIIGIHAMAAPMFFGEDCWTVKNSDGLVGIKTACNLYGTYKLEGYVQKDGTVDVTALTEEQKAEVLEIVTPASFLTDSSAPIFLAYGLKDEEVIYNHCTLLITELTEAGVGYQEFQFKDSGHKMLFNPTAKENLYAAIDTFLEI